MSNPATPAQSRSATPGEGLPFGRILLFLLLFLSFIPSSRPPEVDLDPSWRMMLGYVLKHGFQFGRDFIFTNGPLGFLLSQTYSGYYFGLTVAWNLAVAAGFALALLRLIRSFSLTRQILICLFFLLILGSNTEQLYMAFILVAGVTLLGAKPPGRARLVLTALLLGVFSLIKFTQCLLSLVIVITVSAEAWWAGRRRDSYWMAGSFFGGVLVLWLLCGQNPLLLPAYLLNSLEVSRGYGETMGVPTPDSAFLYALSGVAGLALYGALALAGTTAPRRTATARLLVFAAATYLSWKHGLVRSDGHMTNFFVHGMLVALLYPLIMGRTEKLRGLQGAALTLAGFACVAGIYLNFPMMLTRALVTFESGVQERIGDLAGLGHMRADQQRDWEKAAALNRMDRTRKAVGTGTVDVLSHFQGVALLNDLNLSPRPVPQGYSAYTPRLAALNAAHYDSARAPDWVLQRIKTIDQRFPTLDDASLQLALVRNYAFVFEDGPYLVWRHCTADDRDTAFKPTPGPVRKARLGEVITIGDLSEQNLWAHLVVEPTLLGRLRAFFYKPAELQLEVTDSTGRVQNFRLLREMAASGFLLNPVLRDQFDWIRFINRLPCARVVALKVKTAPGDSGYYQENITCQLDTLPAPPLRRNDQDESLLATAGGFRNLPMSLAADAPLGPATTGGEQAILIHAPSEMVFNVGPGATSFRARYGIADAAYKGAAHTAGAHVVVEWQTAAGSRTLFERKLDPLNQVADRGLHTLELDLHGLGAGILVIKNTVEVTNAWAWTTWRDLEILPIASTGPGGQPMLTGSNHVIMRYGRFAAPPLTAHAAIPVIAVNVDGTPMIQAHAPSEIALQIPKGSTRVVGRFAFQRTAYTNGAATDGAEFSVVWKSGEEEHILLKRYLDPLHVPGDRGVQTFSAELGDLPRGGTLLLRTDPGPAHDSSWDWTCWSDVAVGNPAPLSKIAPTVAGDAAGAQAAEVQTKLLREAGGFKTMPTSITALIAPGAAVLGEFSAVQVHPPSEMVFALGAAPTRLFARFGLQAKALDQTDGVDVTVEWHGPTGDRRSLFRRNLRPVTEPADRIVQTIDLPLTGLSGGTLHLVIGCGDLNNPAFDWACWQGVEITGAAPDSGAEKIPFTQSPQPVPRSVRTPVLSKADFTALGFNVPPVEWQAFTPPNIGEIFGEKVLQVHAPGRMVIPMPADSKTLTGRFGIQEGAYTNDNPTDGATFIIEWAGENGDRRELFRHDLDPFKNINDRGLHAFSVSLDGFGRGDLVFRTDPGPNKNQTSDWTCWQGIQVK
jgi:hypothetical protein